MLIGCCGIGCNWCGVGGLCWKQWLPHLLLLRHLLCEPRRCRSRNRRMMQLLCGALLLMVLHGLLGQHAAMIGRSRKLCAPAWKCRWYGMHPAT